MWIELRQLRQLLALDSFRNFGRAGEAIELTQPAPVQALLDCATDKERTMRRIKDLLAERLCIGAGPMAADGSVGVAVGRMLEQHPEVRISVAIADWPQLTDRVLAGDIEFAVAEISLAHDEPRLKVDELPQHRCMWFCRPGHPLTRQARVTTDDLRQLPFASPTILAHRTLSPAGELFVGLLREAER